MDIAGVQRGGQLDQLSPPFSPPPPPVSNLEHGSTLGAESSPQDECAAINYIFSVVATVVAVVVVT